MARENEGNQSPIQIAYQNGYDDGWRTCNRHTAFLYSSGVVGIALAAWLVPKFFDEKAIPASSSPTAFIEACKEAKIATDTQITIPLGSGRTATVICNPPKKRS